MVTLAKLVFGASSEKKPPEPARGNDAGGAMETTLRAVVARVASDHAVPVTGHRDYSGLDTVEQIDWQVGTRRADRLSSADLSTDVPLLGPGHPGRARKRRGRTPPR